MTSWFHCEAPKIHKREAQSTQGDFKSICFQIHFGRVFISFEGLRYNVRSKVKVIFVHASTKVRCQQKHRVAKHFGTFAIQIGLLKIYENYNAFLVVDLGMSFGSFWHLEICRPGFRFSWRFFEVKLERHLRKL